jgi:lipopolysaccharide export system permease protein
MYLIDRLLIRSFIKSYIICLVSLLTLYIVVDLFTNLDDFYSDKTNLGDVLRHIGFYYGFQVAKIFNSLSEVIILLAATFTVALVQRNNELLPLLSAGVPTRRVVLPVVLGACSALGLSVANQEMIVSQVGLFLLNSRDDPRGEREMVVQGAFEPNGIHIDGKIALRQGLLVKKFHVNIPENLAGNSVNLRAEEARYIPPQEHQPRTGGWLLTNTTPQTLDNVPHEALEMIDPGKFFLKTRDTDFDTITRSRTWFVYASTYQLWQELSKPDSTRMASMAVMFHMRLTRPLLGMILVVMGLSIILRDQNRNVFISAGLCLLLCGMFFAVQFACKSLGESEYVAPSFAAWLPVLFFGPFCFAMFDAIHT